MNATAPSLRRIHVPNANIDDLTFRERAFVEAVSDGLSHRQAAKRAGFADANNPAQVSRVATRPPVVAAIQERQLALREKFALKREDVVKGILSAIDDAKTLSDPATQIKGWSELAKMFGYYEPERRVVEISVEEATAKQQLATMSNEDLARLAGGAVYDAVYSVVDDEPE